MQYTADRLGYYVVSRSYMNALSKNSSIYSDLFDDLESANEQDRSQIASFGRFVALHQQSSWAQRLQDLWVIFELGEIRGGFFVEFGASDGIRNSNTYLLEREYGWTGVLLEPVPEAYRRLTRNRPSALCIEACVAPGVSECVLVVPEDTQLASSEAFNDKDFHRGYRKRSDRRIVAKAIEVNSAIALGNPTTNIVHFISIDIEGGEPDVLESIDFAHWRILCVCVEHNHRDPDRQRLQSFMYARGFSLAPFVSAMRQDYWFINRQLVLDLCGPGSSSGKGEGIRQLTRSGFLRDLAKA